MVAVEQLNQGRFAFWVLVDLITLAFTQVGGVGFNEGLGLGDRRENRVLLVPNVHVVLSISGPLRAPPLICYPTARET